MSPLCQACLNIFADTSHVRQDIHIEPKADATSVNDRPTTRTEILAGGHYSHPNHCKAAADKGCSICHIVFERFSILFDQIRLFTKDNEMRIWQGHFTEYQVRPWSRRRGKRDVRNVPSQACVLEITFESIRRVNYLPTQFDTAECMVEFILLPCKDGHVDSGHRPDSTNTGSSECWDLITTWLDECLFNHTICNAPATEAPFRPTRLLEISDGGDLEVIIKLREDVELGCKYIAVSHRWAHDMLVLEDENLPSDSKHKNIVGLEELRNGIAVSRLSLTFQDAVSATKRLGITYLWIDALCIIQNGDDWKTESIQMHNVYGNAFCTLAATSSVDGSGRLFKDRGPDSVPLPQVTPSWGHERSDLEALPREPLQIVPLDFWRANVHDAALNRRGWVLQERVLSKRVLHFGRNQLFWECGEWDRCEAFPLKLPPLLAPETRLKEPGSKTRPAPIADVPASAEEPHLDLSKLTLQDSATQAPIEQYLLWSRILEKYCSTNLSFGKDKLVAISGLAKRMEAILGDTYFSGLWKAIMPSQLLWRVEHYETVNIVYGYPSATSEAMQETQKPRQVYSKRSESYRAPSWSWASLDSAIVAPHPTFDQGLIQFVGVGGIQLDGLAVATDLILQGALHMGGTEWEPMIRRWKLMVKPLGFQRPLQTGSTSAASAASTLATSESSVRNPAVSQGPQAWAQGMAYFDEEMDEKKKHPVFCLPILRRQKRHALRPDIFDTSTERISGLLLMPWQPFKRGAYRRVGMFDMFRNDLVLGQSSSDTRERVLFTEEGNIILA